MIRRAIAFVICVSAVLTIGCENVPTTPTTTTVQPTTTTTTPHNETPQVPGTVHLEGDSLTFGTYTDTGLAHEYTTSYFAVPSSSIDYAMSYDGPAMDRIPVLVEQGKLDKLIFALGMKEIQNDGFSLGYEWLWTALLDYQVPSSTCVVLVKPWALPQAYDEFSYEGIMNFRRWINRFTSAHPNVIYVDWKPILEANTHFSEIDGVHLDPGTGAAEARDAMYRDGLSRCN